MNTLIVIVGMILPQVISAAAIGTTIVILLRTKAGRGIVRRLTGPDLEVSGFAKLQEEVAQLREELVETQERLDFAERAFLQSSVPSADIREATPGEVTPV